MIKLLKILLLFIFSLTLFGEDLKIVYNAGTPPLKFTDNRGNANGMLIDIWKLWANKNGHNIEFIELSWEETLEAIKNDQAHIHAGLYYTKERDKFLDYPKKHLYKNKNYFFYNKRILNVKNLSDLAPFVVGIGNGYPNQFMKEYFPNLAVKRYSSSQEVSKALIKGDVKVALSAMPTFSYFIQKNNNKLNDFKYKEETYAYSKDYFGAVKQGNSKLLKLINDGFERVTENEIKIIEQKWTDKLKDNYLKELNSNTVITQDQKEYLLQKKSLKMCVDPNWLPLEAIENHAHVGIVADIFHSFNQKIPISIDLVETKTWKESLQKVKNKECDFLPAAAKTKQREEFLNFTSAYLKFPQVLVTKSETTFIDEFEDIIDRKIGVVENSAVVDLLKDKYPKINLVDVKNISEGLMLVSQGKLFGFVNTSAAISYYVTKEGLTNLKIASRAGIDYYVRTAVRSDDKVLLNIFNKLINSLDYKVIEKTKQKWLNVKVEKLINFSLVYKTAGVFLVIVLVILYWNRKLKLEIIERKKLQKELSKMQQVIEQSNVSVITTDLDGKIEYINPYCMKISGYTKEELLGKTPSIFKSDIQDSSFYENLWDTISNGKTWYGEFGNKTKEGKLFWESAVIAPIFDKSKNKIIMYASIKENIDDKVKARDQLEKAKQEALLANSAKSEFLAKMSHEIRTPMNAILGMLYLLEKTTTDDIQENYIKKANHAANSLLALINDILDFSKIEAGKLDIYKEELEFNSMISDVLSVMSFKAEQKNIELLVSYDENIPSHIITDKLRLTQVITNLLSNAIKFTNHGEVILSTKLVKKDDENLQILFCVKDSGIGIEKKEQEKLFKEFSQVDNSNTRSFQGTGLGLAISKKLANLLGGDIWLEDSKEGVGSTFCFSIKAKESKDIKLAKLPNDKIQNLKCLIVDDSPTAIEVLRDMLESFSYKVKSVQNGKDAIALIKKESFDLLFLDFKMEPLDGLEVFSMVQSELQKANTKTIIISAYSKDVISKNIINKGVNGYLSKPVSPSTLYNKIVEIYSDEQIEILQKTKQKVQRVDFSDYVVLLVEDNELNQEFVKQMMQIRGFKIDIASDGIEALSKIKDKQYDLVLMDIQMPHMDGLEATKHIRNMDGEYFQKVPIFALSANALVGDKEKSLDAGMDEHITKPINPDKFFEKVSNYLDPKVKNVLENCTNDLDLDNDVFNVQQTLKTLNNNTDVYIKLLKQFYSNYENIYEILNEHIKTKDIEFLKSKIHEIKGVSGNIGAYRLFETLVNLDRIVKKDQIPSKEDMQEFEVLLKEVFKNIEKLQIKKIDSVKYDKEEVLKLLNLIEQNLENDIGSCESFMEELKPYLEDNFKDFELELAKHIDNFDTDLAKELIDDFIKNRQKE